MRRFDSSFLRYKGLSMKIDVPTDIKYRFSFRKYCEDIISIIPKEDLIGIGEIRFVKNFSHPKSDKDSIACYLQGINGKNAAIEINLTNLAKKKIPDYIFDFHLEIAALHLSEIIYHEIGHHVHTFKRHKIKKRDREEFAKMYAKAGYYYYLKSRLGKILSSYRWGSRMYFIYDKETRKYFEDSVTDIQDWLKENNNGVSFP